jgi:hypothetical protein
MFPKLLFLLVTLPLVGLAPLSAQANCKMFGTGCAGSGGIPGIDLDAGSVPRVNSTFAFKITNLPSQPGFYYVVIGFSKTSWLGLPLPYDLTNVGLWGCTAYISVDIVIPTSHMGTMSTFVISVPNDPSLGGQTFFAQGVTMDFGINPFGGATSNGLEFPIQC